MRKAFMLLAILAAVSLAAVAINQSTRGASQDKATTINQPEPAIEPVQSNSPEIPESSKAVESVSDTPQQVQTHTEPSVTPKPQQQSQEQPQPERIPFTNKPVTAGDPESYVDTYGQCPFYENAGPKGCVPPPDIECNEDWSVCTYRESGQ